MAQNEARELKHSHLGTEHLLLGLLREQEGIAGQALASFDVTLERVRAQVVRVVAPGEKDTADEVPFTPRAKKVLELSLMEMLNLRRRHVRPEHILLGLARANDGTASHILLGFDADSEKIRGAVMRLVSPPTPPPAVTMAEPASGFDPWIRIGPAEGLRRLLMVAAARALDDGRSEIETSDVLLALTRDEKAGALLAGLRVDEAAVSEAIRRAGGPKEPPPAGGED